MKMYDLVMVENAKDYILRQGVRTKRVGKIISPDIEDASFMVAFVDERCIEEDLFACIKIEDLVLVEKGFANDKIILRALERKGPKTWCKVENGFIVNLEGDRKNKIAYDYNS